MTTTPSHLINGEDTLRKHAECLQDIIVIASQDKKNYYLSKATIASDSLNNPTLLTYFEEEALIKGITTEELRDLVLEKSNAAYAAFNAIENQLKIALSAYDAALGFEAKKAVVVDFITT